MTIIEVIDGLQMTVDLFLLDPTTGGSRAEEGLNDMDRETVRACKGAIKLLEELLLSSRWTKSADRLPEVERTTEYLVKDFAGIISTRLWHPRKGWGKPVRRPHDDVKEWMEVPR